MPHVLLDFDPDLIEFLQFNWTSGWELVVLPTKLSMKGEVLVHGWSWCSGLNEEFSISDH